MYRPVHAAAGDDFVMTWKTDNPGTTNSSSINVPMDGGTNYSVDWNDDGTFDQTGLSGAVTHDFGTPGTYTIRVSGNFGHIAFSESGDAQKLISIDQWGTSPWTTMAFAFDGCVNLVDHASDAPNLSNTTDMSYAFLRSSFNGDLSNWDVSNVTNMSGMFAYSEFNGNISNWDVSNVTNMDSMFIFASAFNQDLSNWDVSNVTNMSNMLYEVSSFNSDLSNWNVGNVTNMSGMFTSASAFNSDLSNWDVSHVTTMNSMFASASIFNQDLSNWNVSNVTSMNGMFHGASAFNGNISNWNVSNVTDMSYMFYAASAFNSDLSNWDVSHVTTMNSMFASASAFNGNISNWNVSHVIDMDYMFYSASAFNQDLSNWNVSNVTSMSGMLDSSDLSPQHYDSLLIGWSTQPLQNNVQLSAINVSYCFASPEKQSIINTYHWTIDDSGVGCSTLINSSSYTSFSVPEGSITVIGTLSTTSGITPRLSNPYSLSCTTPGSDDHFFAISGNQLLTNGSFTSSGSHSSDPNYSVCVRVTDQQGRTIDSQLELQFIPEKKIMGADFSEQNGKKLLTISGTSLLDANSSEYGEAVTRSLVTLNGTPLPFCAVDTGMTADEWISTYVNYGYDLHGLVSDNGPCYYLIGSGPSPLINDDQAVILLPDNFNISTEGSVSVNGSNTYTFNATEHTSPTLQVNGTKSIDQHPDIAKRPIFSGVALSGSHITVLIDSDKIACTTTADSNGNWSCSPSTDLSVGTHIVQAQILDPDNNETELGPYMVEVSDTSSVPLAPNTGFMRIYQQHMTTTAIRRAILIGVAITCFGLFFTLIAILRKQRLSRHLNSRSL